MASQNENVRMTALQVEAVAPNDIRIAPTIVNGTQVQVDMIVDVYVGGRKVLDYGTQVSGGESYTPTPPSIHVEGVTDLGNGQTREVEVCAEIREGTVGVA